MHFNMFWYLLVFCVSKTFLYCLSDFRTKILSFLYLLRHKHVIDPYSQSVLEFTGDPVIVRYQTTGLLDFTNWEVKIHVFTTLSPSLTLGPRCTATNERWIFITCEKMSFLKSKGYETTYPVYYLTPWPLMMTSLANTFLITRSIFP
jgi:hypothetical protein